MVARGSPSTAAAALRPSPADGATGTLRLLGAAGWPDRPFASERLYQLATFLACRAGWAARDALAALLWPDLPQADARRNLRKLLYRMQRAPGFEALEVHGDAVRWAVDSDLRAFERAGADGAPALAFAHYGGPLAPGLELLAPAPFADWVRYERERLAAAFRQAACALLAAAGDDPDERARVAHRWLAIDPLDEDAARAAAQALLDAGQPQLAHRLLASFTARLAETLGAEPSAQLRALALVPDPPAHGGDGAGPDRAPRRHDRGAVRATLAGAASPAPGRDLVGRRIELRTLVDLLAQPDGRLVSITGPGGTGKSRLARAALEAACRSASRKTDAAAGAVTHGANDATADPAGRPSSPAASAAATHPTTHPATHPATHASARPPLRTAWIPLEDLSGLDELPPRLAEALGASLNDRRGSWAALAPALGGGATLAVLDGGEHLPGLGAALQALLDACPALRLVVTSRARLGVSAEWLLPLEGLPVPDPDERDDAALAASDAVRLFVQRARAVAPGFDPNGQLADIAALVRALDGMPLAIELAAGWTRLLPVAGLLKEVGASLDLLARGGTAGTNEGRRDSVRASFAHSWRLLAPHEQAALARLAVLDGWFDREAAATVAQAPLAVLAPLVDHSLLRADGAGRFSLHALIRQCIVEVAPPPDGLRAAHASFFARFAARYADFFGAVDQRVALEALGEAEGNCRAAWQWAVAAGRHDLLQQMAPALLAYFETRGRWREGVSLFAAATAVLPPPPAARLLHVEIRRGWAQLLYRCGDAAAAETHARAALALHGAGDPPPLRIGCLRTLSLSLWQRGHVDRAIPLSEEALALARADGHPAQVARAAAGLALMLKAAARLDDALPLYEQAVAAYRHTRDRAGLTNALANLGNLHRARGEPAAAARALDEALRLARANGFHATTANLVLNLGLLHIATEAYDAAAAYFAEALPLLRADGEPYMEAAARLGWGQAELRAGRLPSAAAHLRDALAFVAGLDDEPMHLCAIAVVAEWIAADGDRAEAGRLMRFVVDAPRADENDRRDAQGWLRRWALPEDGDRPPPGSDRHALLTDLQARLLAQAADAPRRAVVCPHPQAARPR